MSKILSDIYTSARCDNWSGQLIREESTKAHNTIRYALERYTVILTDPNSDDETRKWARAKIDQIM